MPFAQLKDLRGKRAKATADAGVFVTKAASEGRQMTPEELASFEKFHKEGDSLQAQIVAMERQDDAERSLALPAADARQSGREDRTGQDTPENRDTDAADKAAVAKKKAAYRSAYNNYIRFGHDQLSPEQRGILREGHRMAQGNEARALSAVAGTAGGYTVPEDFERKLDVAIKWFGGMIESAVTIETTEGQILPYPSVNDTDNTASNIAENTTVASNVDPNFGVINFSAYMYTSDIVKIPIQLLEDSAFDIESMMVKLLGIRIGRKLNTDLTVGVGANQPKGLLTAATSSGITTASTTAVVYNELVQLMHSVDKGYRNMPGTGWMMNDLTLSAVRQLADSQNRPLFVAGGMIGDLSKTAPDMILGYPVFVNNDMTAIAATVKSVLFGALQQYMIRRVKGVNMIRFNERFADALQVGFLAYIRADGNLVDAGTHPVKYITQHS